MKGEKERELATRRCCERWGREGVKWYSSSGGREYSKQAVPLEPSKFLLVGAIGAGGPGRADGL